MAVPTGHPVGALFWRWHFPPPPLASRPSLPRFSPGLPFYSQDFDQTITNTEDVPTSFYETFTNGELKAVLTIPNINRRYHAANLSCETAHDTGVSKRTDVNVKIRCEFINVKNNVWFNRIFILQPKGRDLASFRRSRLFNICAHHCILALMIRKQSARPRNKVISKDVDSE